MEFPAVRPSDAKNPPNEGPDERPSDEAIRDRLRGVMVFRVLLVTALLGGALAIDVETFSSLSDTRNLILIGLIVGTYALTIGYALLLNRLEKLYGLAVTQIGFDVVLTGVLVGVTGGIDSVFGLLFYLSIINAALVLGRRWALFTAGATSLLFVLFAVTSGWTNAATALSEAPGSNFIPRYFEVTVNCIAAFLIALLAGALSERLGEATVQLEKRRRDLKELRALNRNILQSLSSGLLTVDEDKRIIFANRAAADMTGIPEDELLGARLEKTLPRAAETIDQGDTIPPADEVPSPEHRFETKFERKDGDIRYLGFSVSILRDDHRRDVGRIIVFQDLTDIRRMEREMRRSERLAAVGKLAASIAHEIRNPLASISGSVEMLRESLDDEQDDGLMDIILREVERLDDLITDFLEYSRPSSITREMTDLRELTEDVLELFDRREKTISTQLQTNDADRLESEHVDEDEQTGRWCAEVDREAIRQVLWNLLNNARDAMTELTPDDRQIRIGLSHTGSRVRIIVEDAGPGVDDDIRDEIFEPFFTTREQGTGLGLATSYRLVDEHGGHLRVESSNELKGARFVIDLPSETNTSTQRSIDQAGEHHA